MLIFGDIVLKCERDCVKCCDLAFLSSPAPATITKTENLYSKKKKKNSLSFCNFSNIWSNFDSWKTHYIGLPFRGDQDYASSQKGSRRVTILFWACHF